MRLVRVNKLKAGDILGKNLYTSDGTILLKKGVKLTPGYISKLDQIGVSTVYILDPRFDDVKVDDPISEKTRMKATSILVEIAKAAQLKKNADPLAISSREIEVLNKKIDAREIKSSVNDIVEELINKKEIIVHLADLKERVDYLLEHSITTTVLATLCGIQLGMSVKELEDLALGSLLHDIGLVYLEPELVTKQVSLMTAEEIKRYQEHTLIGSKVLKSIKGMNIFSANVAFQHHEALDGQGYPRNLLGHYITKNAKIVGVVDFFDGLIKGNLGEKLLPHQAFEMVLSRAGIKLEHEVVAAFAKTVALYPNGCSVRLNTNEIGVVVRQTPYPTRPVVRVLVEEEEKEEKRINIKEFDMTKNLTVFITEVLN